jgi:parallel beta-helix repeat protein
MPTTTTLMPPPKLRFETALGTPLLGGKVYTFAAGGSNPKATFTDAAGTTPHENPITLNLRGEPPSAIYWSGNYRVELRDGLGNLVYSVDNYNTDPAGVWGMLTQLAAQAGAALVGFIQNAAGAKARSLQDKVREWLAVTDFFANGQDGDRVDPTGIIVSTKGLQAALDVVPAYGELEINGTFLIDSELIIKQDNIRIHGKGRINAKAGTNFEYMMKAIGRTGVTVEGLKFDANKDARAATQNVRFMGLGFIGCTECEAIGVRVKGARGYGGVSAVGIAAAGGSIRCRVDGCTISDCGDAGNAPATDADAIFTSGEQNVITGCIAANCTDTGFVIESSNQSVISACTARFCGAGAGITSANNSDKSGNIIDGVTVYDWFGSVGAVQIGIPGGYTGNLLESKIANVTIIAERPAYGGPGPAVLVSGTAGFGEVKGVTISNLRVKGAATQGVIVQRGTDVRVENSDVSGTTDACIQFNAGTGHQVIGCRLRDGSFGVLASTTAQVFTQNNVFDGVGYGLAAFNTSQITSAFNWWKLVTAGRISKDAGATITAAGTIGLTQIVTNGDGAAPVGAMINKYPVCDVNGTVFGWVPIYNT